MKKLSSAQMKTRDHLAESLESAAEEIRQFISKTNELLEEAQGQVEALTARYDQLVQEANTFVAGVHDDQENFFNDRSDSWQVGDAGQAYQYWADQWSNDLEEMDEVEFPEPIEEPEFEAIAALRDLPDCP